MYTFTNMLLVCVTATYVRYDLRDDGVPVLLLEPEEVYNEFFAHRENDYPFKPFPADFVKKALSETVDWRKKHAVSSVKDQGPHGYCGTFGRVASAEGQFAIRTSHSIRNFSVEQLIDCIGWDLDQTPSFIKNGFMSTEDYPYNITKYPDQDPPIPGNPCRFQKSKVIADSRASNHTGVPPKFGEDQFAAFINYNGPVQAGINADVFREADKDHFVTKEGCAKIKGDIDHSITLVGYGKDPQKGEYWLIKNSWGADWADHGYIKIARGVNCGNILEADAAVYTYGDPAKYYM